MDFLGKKDGRGEFISLKEFGRDLLFLGQTSEQQNVLSSLYLFAPADTNLSVFLFFVSLSVDSVLFVDVFFPVCLFDLVSFVRALPIERGPSD